MKWNEQGTSHTQRYTVVPRTLCFLTFDEDVLLIRGAPDKKIWAGKLNGIGGHIEPGEDPLASARREIREETGLIIDDLALRGIVHVSGRHPDSGVMLFVYLGQAPTRHVRPSDEGTLEWHGQAHLLASDDPLASELVADLPQLLPRVLSPPPSDALVYGLYVTDAHDDMAFFFSNTAGG